MKHRLTQSDIDDYNSLPPKEKIKAWESLKRLEKLGELEPIAGLIQPPENTCHVSIAKHPE